MKARALLLGILLAAPMSGAAEPPRSYAVDARVAYIEGALAAVAASSPADLTKDVEQARTLARGACAAGAQMLRVECLLVAMQRICRERPDADPRRCRFTMDVIVSNVLADDRLIPPAERYRILRDNSDYRAALARELRRIQGTLSVDFRLHTGDSEDPHTVAANIDKYCLTSADDTTFPYPTCVSSLVWFLRGPR